MAAETPNTGDVADAHPATIRDVARLAGVDTSTVSRVLRNDPRQVVRPETRERIHHAAQLLQYRPNAVGRSLRTRRTDTYAVIVPQLDNPGFVEVIRGIQMEAARQGKLVMLVDAHAVGENGNGVEQRQELFSSLVLDGRVDGLIVAFATVDDQLVTGLSQRRVPLVLVNRRMPAVHGSVAVDDAGGAALATRHLIELGHVQIAYAGFEPETDTSRRREAGYRAAMGEAGLMVDPGWVRAGPPSKAGGRAATEQILEGSGKKPPTALLVSNLVGALGALQAARNHGVAIPDDLSVVAFNDHDLADDTDPPLTTVRMPNIEMGRRAMDLVVRAAAGLEVGDIMVDDPPRLVLRASTAAPRSAA
jgi:LacI family transcriptional regulator